MEDKAPAPASVKMAALYTNVGPFTGVIGLDDSGNLWQGVWTWDAGSQLMVKWIQVQQTFAGA